jgi:hypothetical protein
MDDMNPDTKVLASGRIAYTDTRGVATLETCTWMVEVPSGHPEPDSPSDCWTMVACGAPVYAINGDLDTGYYCSEGHRHLTYGSPAQQVEEALEAFMEEKAATNPRLAAALDRGETYEDILAF